MKINWRHLIIIISIIIGIVGMGIILQQYSFKDIFQFFKNFDWRYLILYIVAVFLIQIVLTWRWKVVIDSRKIKIPFWSLVKYRIVGTSINFLTPGPRVGGEPTQATLMKKHGVEFTEGLTSIMIDKIIDVSTSGILFMFGVFLLVLNYALPENTKYFLLIGGIAFVAIITLFYYRMLTSQHFFLKIFHLLKLDRLKAKWIKKTEKKIEEVELMMIQFYKHDKKHFIYALLISVLSWVLMFFEYKLATTLLGVNANFAALFVIISFVGIACLFPIPMSIGALEASQISAFAVMGLGTSAGVALAFLIRFKDIFVAIVGLIILLIYGINIGKFFKEKYEEDLEFVEKQNKEK